MSIQTPGGGLAVGNGNHPIQAATAARFQDGGTTQISPLTVSSSALTIDIPPNALWLIYRPDGADMLIGVGDLDGTDGDGAFTSVAGVERAFACVGNSNIKVKRADATDVTLEFYFETLDVANA